MKVMVEGRWGDGGGHYAQTLYKTGNDGRTDDEPYLQELRVWRRFGAARVTVGQMKPPFGWERFTADSQLALIGRAPVTDLLIPDGSLGESFARDRGLQCDWAHRDTDSSFGVFDRAGANNTPHGLGPLVATRVAWDHALGTSGQPVQVHAEAAVAWRHARDLDFSAQLPGSASLGHDHFTGHDWRADMAVGLRGPRWEARGEYTHTGLDPSSDTSADVSADGFYVQGSYCVTARFEGAVKYDRLNPRRGVSGNNDRRQVALGLNCYTHASREKVQLNCILRDASRGPDPEGARVCQYQRFF